MSSQSSFFLDFTLVNLLNAIFHLQPQNQYSQCFCGHLDMFRVATFWVTQSAHSQLRPNKVTLPSCFSSHNIMKCPFLRIFSSYFLHFEGVLFFILLFQMFSKPSAELLLTVQSSRMLFYALLIKCMLDKLQRHELLYCWLWV